MRPRPHAPRSSHKGGWVLFVPNSMCLSVTLPAHCCQSTNHVCNGCMHRMWRSLCPHLTRVCAYIDAAFVDCSFRAVYTQTGRARPDARVSELPTAPRAGIATTQSHIIPWVCVCVHFRMHNSGLPMHTLIWLFLYEQHVLSCTPQGFSTVHILTMNTRRAREWLLQPRGSRGAPHCALGWVLAPQK